MASPQARDSCAAGYTGTAAVSGPGHDDDERTLGPGGNRIHPYVPSGLVACSPGAEAHPPGCCHSPQVRGSCASGYTGTATAFEPGRDDDERALWSGEELDIPVASPLTLVAVPTLVAIEAQKRPKRRGDPAAGPSFVDPASDFVGVDGAARKSARAEIRQLAPDLMAPLAQQPSFYPGEGVWSLLLHQNSKR